MRGYYKQLHKVTTTPMNIVIRHLDQRPIQKISLKSQTQVKELSTTELGKILKTAN